MKYLLLTLALTLSSFAMAGSEHNSGEFQMSSDQPKQDCEIALHENKSVEKKDDLGTHKKRDLDKKTTIYRTVETIFR